MIPAMTESLSNDSDSNDAEVGSVAAAASQMIWEYLDNNGWKEYGTLHQARIEAAYLAFCANPSLNKVKIQTDMWTYDLDLAAMVQTNAKHPNKRQRLIRRRPHGASLVSV
jgi:WWE domain